MPFGQRGGGQAWDGVTMKSPWAWCAATALWPTTIWTHGFVALLVW